MKATLRNGKGSALHNDRSFKGATEEQKEEIFGVWKCIKKSADFRDCELQAYNYLFGDWLEATNEKYIQNGHKERCKTMEQILGGTNKEKTRTRYEPEETILQIGKNGENISDELFMACLKDYLKRIQQEYGANMQILDYAIHKENSSVMHCHIRRVWYAIDENGMRKPAKKEALRQLGYEMNEGIKEDRFHNLTMGQTEDERRIWYDILAEHGLQIDEIPDIDNATHLTTKDYVRKEQARQRQLNALDKAIKQDKAIHQKNQEILAQDKEEIAQTQAKKKELGIIWENPNAGLDDIINAGRF